MWFSKTSETKARVADLMIGLPGFRDLEECRYECLVERSRNSAADLNPAVEVKVVLPDVCQPQVVLCSGDF